jgi:hypothetical protein
MIHYIVNQPPHWACRQYGHPGGTRGWLGVKCCRIVNSVPRWRLSLSWPIQSDHLSIADCDDTAFGAGTLTWQDPVQESRSFRGHDCGKFISIYLFNITNT